MIQLWHQHNMTAILDRTNSSINTKYIIDKYILNIEYLSRYEVFESNIPGALQDSWPKHTLVTPPANTHVSKLCEVLRCCEMFVE